MRGEVIDEYEEIVEGLAGENEETRRIKSLCRYFILHDYEPG
jgi:hypothetical protein